MNPEDLQLASYRNAAWFVSSAGTAGGRKDAKKEIIGSDTQVIEDLGLRQRVFTLSGVVSARRSNDGAVIASYQQIRDRLLEALEQGGPGILIHPLFGRLENIVCRTYTLNEDIKKLGEASIDITFEVTNTTGAPQPTADVLDGVISGNLAVVQAVNTDVADFFSVTRAFTQNFEDSLAKGNAIADAVREATEPVAVASDQLDEFSAGISGFTTNVASLVLDPIALADAIVSLVDSINGVYTGTTGAFEATLQAYTRLFSFGDDDTDFNVTTVSRTERQKNRNVLNNSIQTLGLSYAYENASQVDFGTTNDIDSVATLLEDQYQKLVDSGTLNSDVEEELTQLRITTTDFFNEALVQKPRVVEVETGFTSTRLLAFQYYGSSELGESIARLNELDSLNAVIGKIDIFTA